MGKYFGTDGFRGEANVTLTAEHAYKIGRFLGWYYSSPVKKARVVIGKDTRRSSYMLEYAIAAGLTASGADAYILHVTTTPSVSYVTRSDDFDCGVMISASHNSFEDNGIKLINSRGEKMDDEAIEKIEEYLDGSFAAVRASGGDLPLATGANIGCVVDYSAGRNRYIGYLISLSSYSFKRINVALDAANGSAWMIAKSVFDALGAKTYVINAEPDGTNINRNAGSTHIEVLSEFVKQNSCDVGFAFDGDADRCLAVDENGGVITGDHILYILARRMKNRGLLVGNTVVTTVMSNLGLYRALDALGVEYIKTAVGDKYVYEAMNEYGYRLGGEQSGHIIMSKYATTGDGILTSIMLMSALIESKLTMSRLAEEVTMLPQRLLNVSVKDQNAVMQNSRVRESVDRVSERLGNDGRILLRKSGTEPLIRIMVEADTEALCDECIEQVRGAIVSEGLA